MQRQRQLSPGRYETARIFVQKLRRAMVNPERQPLTGAVEVDECFVGGLDRASGATASTARRRSRPFPVIRNDLPPDHGIPLR